VNAALAVLLALAVSLGGNAVLYKAWRGAHDLEVKAETKFEQQRAATEQCNASVAALEQQAADRAAENAKLRQEAQDRRRAQESLAQQILSTPATVPGNDCKSAGDRVRNWLKARKS
jgi:uncharacterized Zn finger protein